MLFILESGCLVKNVFDEIEKNRQFFRRNVYFFNAKLYCILFLSGLQFFFCFSTVRTLFVLTV